MAHIDKDYATWYNNLPIIMIVQARKMGRQIWFLWDEAARDLGCGQYNSEVKNESKFYSADATCEAKQYGTMSTPQTSALEHCVGTKSVGQDTQRESPSCLEPLR